MRIAIKLILTVVILYCVSCVAKTGKVKSNEEISLVRSTVWTGIPEGWKPENLWEMLTAYLMRQVEKDLPGCDVTEDGQLYVLYRSRDYTVERPTSKSGRKTETRIETGPQPDGLIMRVWLNDGPGQLERPQTLDRTYWKMDAMQIYLPELKIYLNANIEYGNKISSDLLQKYSDLIGWMESIVAGKLPEIQPNV